MGTKKKTSKKLTKAVSKRHKELSTPEKTQLALVEGTLAKVKEAARREGLSQSSWMRRVINIALVQHENIFGPLEWKPVANKHE